MRNLSAEHTFIVVTNISTKRKYSAYKKICFLSVLADYRLCGCGLLIVISLHVNYRLFGCSVLMVVSLLVACSLDVT